MVKRSKGFRNKTRKLLRIRGKARRVPPTRILKKFEPGQRARIQITSSQHSGMPHPRYQGKSGTVVEKRGRAYVLEIRDGGKTKRLVAAPVHLQRESS